MKKTFYIASSRDRLDDVRMLAAQLESRGMASAFSWWEHFDHRCSSSTCGIRDRQDLSAMEISAASGCDLFIGVARLGKGSHVELGAALHAEAPRIILVGVNGADSVFYDSAAVERAVDIAGLRDLLGL